MSSNFTTLRATHPDGGVCDLYCSEHHPRLRERFLQFFARPWAPDREPSVLTFENVILADREDAAGLYDLDGRRIDAARNHAERGSWRLCSCAHPRRWPTFM